jgi:hypothetical protein
MKWRSELHACFGKLEKIPIHRGRHHHKFFGVQPDHLCGNMEALKCSKILAIGPSSMLKLCKNNKKGLSNSEFWQILDSVVSRSGEMLLIFTLIFLCTCHKGLAKGGK